MLFGHTVPKMKNERKTKLSPDLLPGNHITWMCDASGEPRFVDANSGEGRY